MIFLADISSEKFDFTTMIPQVDLFSFVFWRKLKTPKIHFEINWPLPLYFIRKVLNWFSTDEIITKYIIVLNQMTKGWLVSRVKNWMLSNPYVCRTICQIRCGGQKFIKLLGWWKPNAQLHSPVGIKYFSNTIYEHSFFCKIVKCNYLWLEHLHT